MAEIGFPTELRVQPQGLQQQPGDSSKGYTGMVDMEGMQIPVLDGVAHYKGKNFQVGSTGAVMDEKGAIQGFVEDGVVNAPDPVRVRNFMNGQPTAGQKVAQDQLAPGLQGIKDSLASLTNSITPNLSSLLAGNPTTQGAVDTLGAVNNFKGGVQNAKNQFKAGAIKKLLGIPV